MTPAALGALYDARLCGCGGSVNCAWCDCVALLAEDLLPGVVPIEYQGKACVWVGQFHSSHRCDNGQHAEAIAKLVCEAAYESAGAFIAAQEEEA